jgi:Flp pilus assembly pilin Flp
MNNLMSRLWNDDAGYILSAESVFLVTITVLGLITGWVAVRNSVVSELTEVSNAISSLSQCYAFSGLSNCVSSTCGSQMADLYTTIGSGVTAPQPGGGDVNRCSLVSP